MKVVNIRYKNKGLITPFGAIEFNENGVVELPEDQAKVLLSLGGLFFDPDKQKETASKVETAPKADSTSPKATSSSVDTEETEDLSKLNIMQLKKLAKEHGIELGDANKKDEIIAVIKSAQ